MALELSRADRQQGEMDLDPNEHSLSREQARRRIGAIDTLNQRNSKGTVRSASAVSPKQNRV